MGGARELFPNASEWGHKTSISPLFLSTLVSKSNIHFLISRSIPTSLCGQYGQEADEKPRLVHKCLLCHLLQNITWPPISSQERVWSWLWNSSPLQLQPPYPGVRTWNPSYSPLRSYLTDLYMWQVCLWAPFWETLERKWLILWIYDMAEEHACL